MVGVLHLQLSEFLLGEIDVAGALCRVDVLLGVGVQRDQWLLALEVGLSLAEIGGGGGGERAIV